MTRRQAEPAIVGDLTYEEFRQTLSSSGVGVQIGPFAARITANAPNLDLPLYRLYQDYPLLSHDAFFSFEVCLREIRRLARPGRYVRFSVDGRVPHEDMPSGQALAVLEWGINLVIAMRSHCFLMLHAAAVEKNGFALVLPGEPGHGKSTLCIALAHRGWRLLSDEFGLIRPGRNELISIPRPTALKNESVGIIRAFEPKAQFGPVIPGTRKGTVAHVKPPGTSVRQQSTGATAAWIVFPYWSKGVSTSLQEMPKAEGFMKLAANAFNYELLGEAAYETIRRLVTDCDCYRLVYADLDDVVRRIDGLAEQHGSR